jgi:MinD-like ATPase involved in chromosome partitioning or flagellar assembly
MIHLLLLEKNAREKKNILSYLYETLTPEACIGVLRDRVDITSGDLDEWNHSTPPAIILLGPDTAKTTPDMIARARNKFCKATIVVMVDNPSITVLQHYTLYGAHNVLGISGCPSSLFGCILSSLSKNEEIRRGRLVLVDSGKGGVGTTTFAAALGASLSSHGLKVTLVDLDFESQDLTRYLKVRPYFNETLELLLTQGNFISVEQVSQSCHKVWKGESLEIVPPAPALEGLLRGNQCTLRQFRLVLEVIDSQRDVVIVDMAGITSSVARKFYDMADRVVYLMSLDPSTVHASLMRLKSLTNATTGEHPVHLVPVAVGRDGISSSSLVKEFERCLKIPGVSWAERAIPYLSMVRQWPASGSSPLEMGNESYRSIFHDLGTSMGFHGEIKEPDTSVIPRIRGLAALVRKMSPVAKSNSRPTSDEKHEIRLLEPPKEGVKGVDSLITMAKVAKCLGT